MNKTTTQKAAQPAPPDIQYSIFHSKRGKMFSHSEPSGFKTTTTTMEWNGMTEATDGRAILTKVKPTETTILFEYGLLLLGSKGNGRQRGGLGCNDVDFRRNISSSGRDCGPLSSPLVGFLLVSQPARKFGLRIG